MNGDDSVEKGRQHVEWISVLDKSWRYDGVGFAVRHCVELAEEFLKTCPVQPGDRAELTEAPWDESACRRDVRFIHLFQPGQRVHIVEIDWRSTSSADGKPIPAGFRATVTFENEVPATYREGRKHLFLVRVSSLRKVEV
jgi:hypothetical protein